MGAFAPTDAKPAAFGPTVSRFFRMTRTRPVRKLTLLDTHSLADYRPIRDHFFNSPSFRNCPDQPEEMRGGSLRSNERVCKPCNPKLHN